jgi:Poxvirus A32 protein
MDYFIYNIDEYQPLQQGNEFAPTWPFRLTVAGSSDSGKTTMIMNLLMGNKKLREDGERYILCNDIILVDKYDEPKWDIVKNFYTELAEEGEDVSFTVIHPSNIPSHEEFNANRSTIVIFEDIMNQPRKIQDSICEYFTHGRHNNISSIYISQRFFSIPKTIRENITYISLHRGGGSLSDIKRIIGNYTEHTESLAPAIDDLTLKKEFIVFDLRKSRDDPLSIRVRWDTSLRSLLDSNNTINVVSVNDTLSSKFSPYGQNAIQQAKKNNTLVEFARNYPSPKERKTLLANKVTVKNRDIWARYVFREAYGITGVNLGSKWIAFSAELNSNSNCILHQKNDITKQSQFSRYKELMTSRLLEKNELIEGVEILLWLFSNEHLNQEAFYNGIKEFLEHQ